MSYQANFFASCPDIQDRLDTMWMTPGMFPGADERMPFAEFLTSTENRRPIVSTIIPGNGKVRPVEVVYNQRRLESGVAFNQPNPNCEATTRPSERVATYELDTDVNIQVDSTMNITDFERVCEESRTKVDREVALMIDQLDRAVATYISQQAVGWVGGWGATIPSGTASGEVNGSGQLVINTRNPGTVTPSPDAWVDLRNALDDSGFPRNVGVFGGTTLRKYMQFLNAGCCNDSGLDLGAIQAQNGYSYSYDMRLQAALASNGANEFLVLAPGALQVLNFARSMGKDGLGPIWNASSNYLYTAVYSPRLGQWYDFTVKDPCGTVSMTLTWTGKVIGMPNDMFAVGDNYEGVTYVAPGVVVNT